MSRSTAALVWILAGCASKPISPSPTSETRATTATDAAIETARSPADAGPTVVPIDAAPAPSDAAARAHVPPWQPATWTAPDGTVKKPYPIYPTVRAPSGSNECASHADCIAVDGGRCMSRRSAPGRTRNGCVYDQCRPSKPCADPAAICVPAGVYSNVAQCVPSRCKSNADCKTRRGGRCVALNRIDCTLSSNCASFVCAYPSSACSDKKGCRAKRHPDGDRRNQRCVADARGEPACAFVVSPRSQPR